MLVGMFWFVFKLSVCVESAANGEKRAEEKVQAATIDGKDAFGLMFLLVA